MLLSVFKSKTMWFNLVILIVAVSSLPVLAHILPQTYLPYDLLVGSVGNLVLRLFFTAQPITQIAADNAPAVVPLVPVVPNP